MLHVLAALQPHPNRARCLRGDVVYCPLCGFLLADDLDGHFTPCLVRRTATVAWHADVRRAEPRAACMPASPSSTPSPSGSTSGCGASR